MNVRLCVLVFMFALCFRFPVYADMVFTSSNVVEIDDADLLEYEQEAPYLGTPLEVYSVDASYSARAVSEADLINCVRYDVVIDGEQYVCLFPSDYESSLMVDSDGYLWNMSSSSVQGRLFSGSFDPTADTGKLLYLGPCLGNNFTNNSSYGSPNYIREYYWSSGRLTYDTYYVVVEVEDTFWLFRSGDTLQYVMVFLALCCLICLWKRSSR